MRNKLIETGIQPPYDNITHVCLTPSIHALLQYLLLFDYDTTAHHTAYFTGYAVSKEIASRLPGVWIPFEQTSDKQSLDRMFDKFRLRLARHTRYSFLLKAKLFAFDVGFVPPLIGHSPYALLSDGPLGLAQNTQSDSIDFQRQQHRRKTLSGRIEQLLFGPVALNRWGNNEQCRELYLTEKNDTPVLQGKKVNIASLRELWDKASNESKNFVKSVFDVSNEDISILNSRRFMFCTQPMVGDGILTHEEYLAILKPLFESYGTQNLLLKLHPRDTFDYQRYFPEVAVYGKKVNMQLLVLLGANVERAITICSSAVNSFPESVAVDWYGTDFHPKLHAWFGTMVPPYRAYEQKTISPSAIHA